MALLDSLIILLCVVMAAGQAIPLDGHTQHSSTGAVWRQHLLAKVPGKPSIANIGTVGPAAYLYIDVWPPTSNGGAAITAYEVTGTPVGGPAPGKPTLQTTGMGALTTGVNNRRFTFANYPRGVPYQFDVRARNKGGLGPASTPPTPFTTPKHGVPGPPVVTLTRLPDGVYLDVTPPAHVLPLTFTLVGHPDGGASAARPRIAITGTGSLVPGQSSTHSSNTSKHPSRRGGTVITQLTRRFKLTGFLTNMVYRFAVTAANSAGTGPENIPRIVFYACSNGFKDTGTGCQCPAIANCEIYTKGSCTCSKCKPYYITASNGSSCKCNVDRTNCKAVAKDGCSCQTCKTGWTGDGSGGCTRITCAPLANCAAYAQESCKCARCNSGWGDCDGNSANGCERALNTTNRCGSCTTKCALANATPTCAGGTCRVASCATGWGDCDNSPANGCERALNTTDRCGSCTTKCALANATPTCAGGTCRVASCAAGWGDCDNNPANGCERALNTTDRCGSCTNKCNLPQATATCDGGTCRVASCAAGWGDCDGNPANGCETALNTTANCGTCNNTCTLPQATTTCGGGACKIASCDAGWGDCDGNPANGCETALNTTANCGACNNTCSLPQATATCGDGTCEVASCDAGWGNCDNESANSCETALNTTANCGACNNTCTLPQATATCDSGTCELASCDAGWGDCDGNPANGCEAPLNTSSNCGSCASVCTADQLCVDNGCVTNALAWAWGWNFAGSLGNGVDGDPESAPVRVSGGLRFKRISAGWEHTCAIVPTGSLWCWGDNSFGQMGDGTDTSSNTPIRVSGDLLFKEVSAGEEHTCGIDTAGQAWCWGGGVPGGRTATYYGQLGGGTGAGSSAPIRVSGGILFKQINAGSFHTCGIDAAGQAWCWGDNSYLQLGDGTDTNSDTPVSVSGGLLFKQISSGMEHTCGIDTAGQAWCWGDNFFGQMGSTVGDSDTPVRVSGGLLFKQISAGDAHTCAIDTSDRAWCWGFNFNGELGDGTRTNSEAPVRVLGDLLFFKQISAGAGHNCGIDTTGQAWCWGDNFFEQLGSGTDGNEDGGDDSDNNSSDRPIRVAGDTLFTSISVGSYHTAALASN